MMTGLKLRDCIFFPDFASKKLAFSFFYIQSRPCEITILFIFLFNFYADSSFFGSLAIYSF